MGLVMKAATAIAAGKADGSRLSAAVQRPALNRAAAGQAGPRLSGSRGHHPRPRNDSAASNQTVAWQLDRNEEQGQIWMRTRSSSGQGWPVLSPPWGPVAEESRVVDRRTPQTSVVRRSLVVRRTVPGGQPRTTPDGVRTPSNWPGTTGGAAPRSTDSTTRDSWGVRWARAYVRFAAGEAVVAQRPRNHLPADGRLEPSRAICGPTATATRCRVPRRLGHRHRGSSGPFVESALAAAAYGLVTFHHRHRVDELVFTAGAVTG